MPRAYHAAGEKDTAVEFTRRILESARDRNAEALVTSCPLCHHNLDRGQESLAARDPGFTQMPVVYFTQAMAFALGSPVQTLGFETHFVDPTGLFQRLETAAAPGGEAAP